MLRQSGFPLLDYLAGHLRLMRASVPGFIQFEKPISKEPARGWLIHRVSADLRFVPRGAASEALARGGFA